MGIGVCSTLTLELNLVRHTRTPHHPPSFLQILAKVSEGLVPSTTLFSVTISPLHHNQELPWTDESLGATAVCANTRDQWLYADLFTVVCPFLTITFCLGFSESL